MKIDYESLNMLLHSKESGVTANKYYQTLLDYYNIVTGMPSQITLIGLIYDGEEYRARIEQMDNTRRSKHDAVISSLNILNRLADREGLSPIIDEEATSENRVEVAQAVYKYFDEVVSHDEHSGSQKRSEKERELSGLEAESQKCRASSSALESDRSSSSSVGREDR